MLARPLIADSAPPLPIPLTLLSRTPAPRAEGEEGAPSGGGGGGGGRGGRGGGRGGRGGGRGGGKSGGDKPAGDDAAAAQ